MLVHCAISARGNGYYTLKQCGELLHGFCTNYSGGQLSIQEIAGKSLRHRIILRSRDTFLSRLPSPDRQVRRDRTNYQNQVAVPLPNCREAVALTGC